MKITFQVVEADLRTVAILLEALTALNQVWLHDHPRTPKLYESGVRFVPEDGQEIWPTIPIVLGRGWGNCDMLAAWLCAQYRQEGHAEAVAFPIRSTIDPSLIHCLVSRDGTSQTIEDPSHVLGSPPVPSVDLVPALERSKQWLRRSCRSWSLPR